VGFHDPCGSAVERTHHHAVVVANVGQRRRCLQGEVQVDQARKLGLDHTRGASHARPRLTNSRNSSSSSYLAMH
jgi:glucosamine 6-phosphate synthetase-like amidotransferase/phosphosugar isomerase protein